MIQGKSFGLLVADVAVTVIWKEKKKNPQPNQTAKKTNTEITLFPLYIR